MAHFVQPPQVGNLQGPQIVNEHDNVGPQLAVQPQAPAAIQAPAVVIQPAAETIKFTSSAEQRSSNYRRSTTGFGPTSRIGRRDVGGKDYSSCHLFRKTRRGRRKLVASLPELLRIQRVSRSEKMQLFKVLMVKNAALWMDALTETVAGDLTQLIQSFEERYRTPQILKYRCSQELFNRRQKENESVDDFIAHLKKLSRTVEAGDKMTIMAIMNGLKPNINLYVMQQKPENLDALLQAPRVAEVTAPSEGPQEGILMQELAEMKTEMRKLGDKMGQITVSPVSRCRARKRGRGRILGSFCSTSHRLAQACPIS